MIKSIRLPHKYKDLQDKQYKKIFDDHYIDNIEYYMYNEDTGEVIDVMRISEIDNVFTTTQDLVDLLNKQRNEITQRRFTMSRMRKDIKDLSSQLSRLKLNLNIKYKELKEEFDL